MTRAEAVRRAADRLRAAGVETPDLDARVLALSAFGIGFATYIAGSGAPAGTESLARLDAALARRLAGEPVARILGRREFWGLGFAVTPKTLAPRPDTETLVEAALEALGDRRKKPSILDLGTGTGCVLLALLSERGDAFGVGVDLSPDAAAVARANAQALGFWDRAVFLAGDWGNAISGRFDLVVSNPPYVETAAIAGLASEVRNHDPSAALDGGPDGLAAYRAILSDLDRLLGENGVAAFELGAGQERAVASLAAAAGFAAAPARRDLAGTPRALALVRNPPKAAL